MGLRFLTKYALTIMKYLHILLDIVVLRSERAASVRIAHSVCVCYAFMSWHIYCRFIFLFLLAKVFESRRCDANDSMI